MSVLVCVDSDIECLLCRCICISCGFIELAVGDYFMCHKVQVGVILSCADVIMHIDVSMLLNLESLSLLLGVSGYMKDAFSFFRCIPWLFTLAYHLL